MHKDYEISATAVLRKLVATIPNLQMTELPKASANSLGLVYALARTDALDGEDWRVWINGPIGEISEIALVFYFRQELSRQGFFAQ